MSRPIASYIATATLRVVGPRPTHALLLVVPFVAVLLAACAKDADEAEAPAAPAAVSATVETVGTAAFDEIVDGVATVTARPGGIAAMAAPAPTRIARVHVAVGDRVSPGTVLVTFDRVRFDAAVESANAALTAAEQAAARADRLVTAGVAPRRDAEAAAAALAAARATATDARRTRQLAELRSPISGVVTRVAAVLGANVDEGTPLVEVADPSRLDLVLAVAPAAAARVRRGQLVSLHESAGTGNHDSTETLGSARVADISPLVDSVTRAVSVRTTVLSSNRSLRIGESVFAEIAVARHAGAVVIPDAALVPNEEGFRVFVVDSAQVAHARDVTVGGRSAGRVWVASGLEAGERIVTAGAYGMDDGAKVVVGGTPAAKVGKPE